MAKCTATSKTTGQQCAQLVRADAKVCRFHGGKAPQVRAKVDERALLAQAASYVHQNGWQPVINPLTALADVAGEITSMKDFLRERVQAIGQRIRETSDKGDEQLRAELAAYQVALRDVVGALNTIARLNIDERLARISEAQGQMILRAFDAGLAAVGVAGPAAKTARQAAVRHLRIVKGEAA